MNSCYRLLIVLSFLYLYYLYFEGMQHHTHNGFPIVKQYLLLGIGGFLFSLFLPQSYLWGIYGILYLGCKFCFRKQGTLFQEALFLLCGIVASCIFYGIENTMSYFAHLCSLYAFALLLCLILYRGDEACDQMYMFPIYCLLLLQGSCLLHPRFPLSSMMSLILWGMFLLVLLLYRMLYCMERNKIDELAVQRNIYKMNEQQQRFVQVEKENEYILKNMHDLKKQLQFLKDVDQQGLQEYRQELHERVQTLTQVQVSGNKIIDKVLQLYQPRFMEAKIQWHLDCDPIDYTFMNQVDLCALLCNLLDNAYESCLHCEERFLLLRMHQKQDHIFWKMKNSCSMYDLTDHSFPHGYGLANIQEIAERYHGSMQIEKNEKLGIFTTILTFQSYTH